MLDQGDVGAFASRRARSVAGHLAFADAEPPSGERGLEVGDGLFEPGRGRSLPAGHAARFPVMGIPISTVSPPITTPTILSTMKAGPSFAPVNLTAWAAALLQVPLARPGPLLTTSPCSLGPPS